MIKKFNISSKLFWLAALFFTASSFSSSFEDEDDDILINDDPDDVVAYDSQLTLPFGSLSSPRGARFFHYRVSHQHRGRGAYSLSVELIFDRQTLDIVDVYVSYFPENSKEKHFLADRSAMTGTWLGTFGNKIKRTEVVGIEFDTRGPLAHVMLDPINGKIIIQSRDSATLPGTCVDLVLGNRFANLITEVTPIDLRDNKKTKSVLAADKPKKRIVEVELPKGISRTDAIEGIKKYLEQFAEDSSQPTTPEEDSTSTVSEPTLENTPEPPKPQKQGPDSKQPDSA
ncbi:MAG: hypothetical protein AB7F43_03080 [Bacteriovoracia bacterium]